MSRYNTSQTATPVLRVPHLLLLIVALPTWAEDRMQTVPHIKPRLIVLTDLSNEPDDEESLVRLLVYSDQFDIEGLIATTSTWLRQNPREDLIRPKPYCAGRKIGAVRALPQVMASKSRSAARTSSHIRQKQYGVVWGPMMLAEPIPT